MTASPRATATLPWQALRWTGTLLAAGLILVPHLAALRRYRLALPLPEERLAAWRAAHRLRRPLRILVSDRIAAPLTYGLLRPVILLPKHLDWQDQAALAVILEHEWQHIRRFDIAYKWLLAAALALYWYHPLVWLCYALANRDLELACDEAALRSLQGGARSSYALTLLRLEENRSPFRALTNHFSKNALEERIVAIMKLHNATWLSLLIGLLVFGLTLTAFAASGAQAPEEAAPQAAQAEATTIVDHPAGEFEDDGRLARSFFAQMPDQEWAEFAAFGLTYEAEQDLLYYDGQPVRILEDSWPVGENGFAQRQYLNAEGLVDLCTVRDPEQVTYNGDGSYDPKGKLTGIAALNLGQAEIEEYFNPTPGTGATTAHYAVDGDLEDWGQTLEDLYAVYAPFGLVYNPQEARLYYNGQLVRFFVDMLSSNGEDPEGGGFSGSVRSFSHDDGEVDVRVLRDYNDTDAEGYGRLLGLEPYSQEEFDSRTERWNQPVLIESGGEAMVTGEQAFISYEIVNR